MKIPKTAIHLIVVLEGIVLAAVLVIALFAPVKSTVAKKNNAEMENHENLPVSAGAENESKEQEFGDETIENTQTSDSDEQEEQAVAMEYSQAVQTKVFSMSLEEKVAQMFITTPEQLTGMRQVTATGNTSKNAIRTIPVGGLMYSELNFEGNIQTASMTEALQEYYMQQFGFPLFMMAEETGGREHSPLAVGNGFEVEPSPEELGALGNTESVFHTAENIAAYMKNQGLNTNTGLDESYSADTVIASSMLDAAITAYKGAGIYTASRVYHAGTDIILMGDEMPLAEQVAVLRQEKQYLGILLADKLAEGQTVTDAILSGADMVYCPADFKTSYRSVLDAVNAGTINEELINEAVMRILTCKGYE